MTKTNLSNPFSKYFFKQFKEDIEEESQKFEAHSEQKEISFFKCKHNKVRYENGELRCPCGASWSGPGMSRLYELLRRDIMKAN